MEFPEFCVMMVKKMRESDIENEVSVALKSFVHFFLGGEGDLYVSLYC